MYKLHSAFSSASTEMAGNFDFSTFKHELLNSKKGSDKDSRRRPKGGADAASGTLDKSSGSSRPKEKKPVLYEDTYFLQRYVDDLSPREEDEKFLTSYELARKKREKEIRQERKFLSPLVQTQLYLVYQRFKEKTSQLMTQLEGGDDVVANAVEVLFVQKVVRFIFKCVEICRDACCLADKTHMDHIFFLNGPPGVPLLNIYLCLVRNRTDMVYGDVSKQAYEKCYHEFGHNFASKWLAVYLRKLEEMSLMKK
jgi:hypothetical protein